MKFYVYELVDPRDGTVFYVGKGQGRRLHAHEDEARNGVCSPKCDVIRDIWAADRMLKKRIIRRFDDEEDAYAFESERIEEIGLENLTNRTGGGGWVRTSEVRRMSDSEFLAKAGPVIAHAIEVIDRGGKIKFGPYDITPAVEEFIAESVARLGLERITAAMAGA